MEFAGQLRRALEDSRLALLERLLASCKTSSDPAVRAMQAKIELHDDYVKALYERKKDD